MSTNLVSRDEFLDECNTFTDCFSIKLSEKNYNVSLNFSKFNKLDTSSNIKYLLHDVERKYFETLKYNRRIHSFLLGRYSAKKAITALAGNEENFTKILIKNGVFNQPIVVCETCSNIQVSLTHCDDLAAAIAFNDMLILGIDIEKANKCINQEVEAVLTQCERDLSFRVPCSYRNFLLMIWTVKESLSKVLKTGLTVPMRILEVKNIEELEGYCVSTFINFPQYSAVSFIVEDYVCSITFPKNVEIYIDINRIKDNLYKIL
jgi:phosphopantetheinyl transferase (holo-ACP synthase)